MLELSFGSMLELSFGSMLELSFGSMLELSFGSMLELSFGSMLGTACASLGTGTKVSGAVSGAVAIIFLGLIGAKYDRRCALATCLGFIARTKAGISRAISFAVTVVARWLSGTQDGIIAAIAVQNHFIDERVGKRVEWILVAAFLRLCA